MSNENFPMPPSGSGDYEVQDIRRQIDEMSIRALGMAAFDSSSCVISKDEARGIASNRQSRIEE